MINFLASIALILPPFLLAVSFHEFSHALAAYYFGDNTAKDMGRLTLNPFMHIDPMGLFFLLVFRIGWARPVIFNPENFKRPKLYSVLTGLAGPLSNFVLALFFLYITKYAPYSLMSQSSALTFIQIMKVTVYINVMLGLFNLMPIPPLDGSHLVYVLIPEKFKHLYFTFARYSIFVFIIVLSFPQSRMFFINSITGMEKLLNALVI